MCFIRLAMAFDHYSYHPTTKVAYMDICPVSPDATLAKLAMLVRSKTSCALSIREKLQVPLDYTVTFVIF